MEKPSNPLLARLVNDSKWPSLRLTLWLTIGLILLGIGWIVYLVSAGDDLLLREASFRADQGIVGERYLSWGTYQWINVPAILIDLLAYVEGNLLMVAPLPVTIVAVMLTTRTVQTEAYQSLYQGALSPRAAVRGLVWGALYRSRVLLVLIVGLAPTLVAAPLQNMQRVASYGCYIPTPLSEFPDRRYIEEGPKLPSHDNPACIDPSDSRLIWQALAAILPAIVWWGIALLGAALGVGLSLWRRKSYQVLAVIISLVLAMIACSILIGPFPPINIGLSIPLIPASVPRRAVMCANNCVMWAAWPPITTTQVLGLPIPYVLAFGFMLLARRWVRKQPTQPADSPESV